MKIVFRIKPDESFEVQLARLQYQQFWDANEAQIKESFYRHTGLRFRQQIITVHVHNGYWSRAGVQGVPMRLTCHFGKNTGPGIVLLHELAHRLLMGHDIAPSGVAANRTYTYHRQIDLFLFDIWSDIFGETLAVQAVEAEQAISFAYEVAWDWALGKSSSQRQATLKRIIARK